jgi:predicted XRE-type DNA-binding protein
MAIRKTKLSDQLRKAIDASEMSRYRICKTIGLLESTMSHFMAKRCGLRLETIDKIGALLDLELKRRAR